MCDPEKEPVKSGCKNCLPKDHIFNNWVCCAGVSSDFFMYHGVVAVDWLNGASDSMGVHYADSCCCIQAEVSDAAVSPI